MAVSRDSTILSRRTAFVGLAALSTAVLSKSTDATSATPVDEEPATDEQWAAMTFEPWQHSEGEWTPPSNKEMIDEQLLPTRLAWALLHKSKEELIASTAAMAAAEKDEGLNFCCDLIERLTRVANNYRALADIVDGAMSRLLVAATVIDLRDA